MRHHFAPGPASLLSRQACLAAGEAARRRPLGTAAARRGHSCVRVTARWSPGRAGAIPRLRVPHVPPEPKVPPGSVRTPVVGSRAMMPGLPEGGPDGSETVCSASCRRERTRQREEAAREARDREIRAFFETALRKLHEGVP